MLALLLGLGVGLALGATFAALWARGQRAAIEERLRASERQVESLSGADERASALRAALERERAHREADQERLAWIHTADEQLRTSFRALSSEALERSGSELSARSAERVGQVVAPVAQALETLDGRLRQLESAREGAYEGLRKEITLLRDAHHQLTGSAEDLRRALGASGPRGRWAEVQLRRLVELAGLVEHVDFDEQKGAAVSGSQGPGNLRPDLVVRLPGDAVLPIDAKSPMAAWLELAKLEPGEESERQRLLDAHHQALRRRTAELSGKDYWRQFESGATTTAPDFVVMYLPHDGVLAAVFESDPNFLDFCVEEASPPRHARHPPGAPQVGRLDLAPGAPRPGSRRDRRRRTPRPRKARPLPRPPVQSRPRPRRSRRRLQPGRRQPRTSPHARRPPPRRNRRDPRSAARSRAGGSGGSVGGGVVTGFPRATTPVDPSI